jgi:hypothetical protein
VNTLEKLLLTLTITFFSISSLTAQPCIGDNCTAKIVESKTTSSKKEFTTFNKEIQTEDEFSMIALDDNIETIELEDNSAYYMDSEIILTDDSENSYTPYTNDIGKLKLAKILYACDDIVNNIVACDEEKREECECV